MEAYILDSLYRATGTVIDTFESFIWTERHRAAGDFQLDLLSTPANRATFKTGTLLAKNDSFRVMQVKTVQDKVNEEGKATLTIQGTSLETILGDRVGMGALADLTTTPKWTLTGLPAALMRQMFHDICVTGVLNAGDIIAGITEGSSLYPTDTIAEPSSSITVDFEPDTLYNDIKKIADQFDLGFRLIRDPNTGALYFDVYTGIDRTTQQTSYTAVVFSPDLGNLQNTTELTTIAGAMNVAYVFSPVGYEIVYPTDVDPSVSGFERHVLLVKADDITDTTASVASAKMIQRGNEALAQARTFSGFDGEISQNSKYVYGKDYNLGDLVELRNKDGAANNMQVVEHISVSDDQGERDYPTFALNEFITPGSWAARDFNQVWADVPDTEHWADLP